jgi:metallophosphoesterase superfamily enzyme
VEVRGTRLRRRCFIADARRLIMPAFGSYTGSLNVRAKAFEGLFGDFDVWMIGTKAIHRFPDAKVSRG